MCVNRRGDGDDVDVRLCQIGLLGRERQMRRPTKFILNAFQCAVAALAQSINRALVEVKPYHRKKLAKLDGKGTVDLAKADDSYFLNI